MFSVKFVKFYRILFLQKTAGRLLSISCNISDISLALLTINQLSNSWLGPPERAVCKHFTVFVSKVFKTTKVEGNIFVAVVSLTNKKMYLAEAVTQRVLQKSVREYLVKLTGKHLYRSLSLACMRETLVKRDSYIGAFLKNSSEQLFGGAPAVNSLITLIIIFNFAENIEIESLVNEASWKRI